MDKPKVLIKYYNNPIEVWVLYPNENSVLLKTLNIGEPNYNVGYTSAVIALAAALGYELVTIRD